MKLAFEGDPEKRSEPEKTDPENKKTDIEEIEAKIQEKILEFEKIRDNRHCFLFLGKPINHKVVNDTFNELRKSSQKCDGRLDVIIDSGGGDIHSAYNLAMLLRKYGKTELNFFVPRWAKSAATLLVCAGDKIYMSPVAELGPLDPQITQIIKTEGREEQFSPLHIESTLDMIRQEFAKGDEKLANGLIDRLQFPLTLGSFIKCIEIGQDYTRKLLSSRMYTDPKCNEIIERISVKLSKGYPDHGCCINIDEAKEIGLKIEDMPEDELDLVWEIYQLNLKKNEIEKKKKQEEMVETLKEIPPDLLKQIIKQSKSPKNKKERTSDDNYTT
jgi:ATP-dependent protease ClpP protease subunit